MFRFMLKNYQQYQKVEKISESNMMKIESNNYVPFYSLIPRFLVDLDHIRILEGNIEPDEFDRLYAKENSWMLNPEYVSFIRKCLDEEMYHLLLLSSMNCDCHETSRQILVEIRERALSRLEGPPRSVNIPTNTFLVGSSTPKIMLNYVRLANFFAEHTMKAGSYISGTYITNMFLLMHKSVGQCSPLIIGMVPWDRAEEVRACFINNTPMPVEALEIWIDSNISPRVKSMFNRYLGLRIKQRGIPVKYFDDLRKEVIVDMTCPNDIRKIPEWRENILKRFYNLDDVELSYLCPTDLSQLEKDLERAISVDAPI